MPTIAIVYFSATGHTQQVAEAVAEGAKDTVWVTLQSFGDDSLECVATASKTSRSIVATTDSRSNGVLLCCGEISAVVQYSSSVIVLLTSETLVFSSVNGEL